MVSPITSAGGIGNAMATSRASMRMAPQQKMSNLFDMIDTAGKGSINKQQLSNAFGTMNPPAVFQNAGVDAVFSFLDPANSGSVSKADFISGMKSLMVSLRQES